MVHRALQLIMLKEARWHFQISAGDRNCMRLAMGLSILACERPSKTVERLLSLVPAMGTPDCYKLKLPKWQSLLARVCMVKIQMTRRPAAWSLRKRLIFESEIFITHGFLVIFSAMRILYVGCAFSRSSPKTEQQNKYLLTCFLKHKEASKGKFKQGLFFSPNCMLFFFLFFFFLS